MRKTIELSPTSGMLDVFVLKDNKKLLKTLKKEYNGAYEGDGLKNCYGFVKAVWSENKKIKKKDRFRIIMCLENFNSRTIVHEIVHVLHYLNRYYNVEVNFESQEWQAQMTDYLFTKISDKKSYKNIK